MWADEKARSQQEHHQQQQHPQQQWHANPDPASQPSRTHDEAAETIARLQAQLASATQAVQDANEQRDEAEKRATSALKHQSAMGRERYDLERKIADLTERAEAADEAVGNLKEELKKYQGEDARAGDLRREVANLHERLQLSKVSYGSPLGS